MATLPRIYDNIFPINSKFNTIKEYFEYFIFHKNIGDLDQPLAESLERKKWLEYYPDISCFPKTLQYIKDETSISLNEVADELSNVFLYLPKGKILFHSGNLPENINLEIGSEFELQNIFSATLDPYIANVHDSDDDIYWFIEVKNDNIRCLPIPELDRGNEYEVIILGSPKVKIIDIKTDKRSPNYLDINMPINYQNIEKTIVYVEFH